MTKIESLAALIRDIIATDNDGPRLIAEVLRDERRIYDELDDGALAIAEGEILKLNHEIVELDTRYASLREELTLTLSKHDEEE
jgi:hypothetical protein